ncbi:hypothetical protein [Duganella sp. Root1480D1]|uniref:hypothetical protein n=1 Tax=Duganella sp. Root1480D1 TaxID=1736471 RepID=UPI000710508E|nr:hypothetical protein [Duganella sp. Root1480D1]KQZ44306.1 hypothetical protein ASD58_19085 [Duganella sp. Root1480D1]
MNKRHFLLALAAAIALPALPALAAEPRPFPPNAKRGKMSFGYVPDIAIDGKLRQLSPAARIYSDENLTVVPASLAEQTFIVNYTEDMDGNVNLVWILTPEEARLPAPNQR